MGKNILIVDDEAASRGLATRILSAWQPQGLKLVEAADPEAATRAVEEELFHVALVDLHYGGEERGFALLARLRELDPAMELVVVSGAIRFADAQAAMRAGAADFVAKGYGRTELVHAVERAFGRRRWRGIERRLARQGAGGFRMVGDSAVMQKLRGDLERIASRDIPVLLEGETGSGKEVAARALHHWGRDPAGPFVAVNCAAVPASTADSYFFGHERGAFTGADQAREGVFEEADGGTLFLDEINSLSADLQGRLLRVLQENEVRRMGSRKTRSVSFRLVAAANRPLAELVREGTFREDLFYRINVFSLRLAPLRERPEDLPGLVRHFLPDRSLEEGLWRALQAHSWPGNVRELRNVLLAMDALAEPREPLGLSHLPNHALRALTLGIKPATANLKDFGRDRDEREKDFFARAYREAGGNVSRLARALGVDRSHLHQKLQKLGIHRSQKG